MDLQKMMEEFEKNGGKVEMVADNVKSEHPANDPRLKWCKCGCEGDYTDHSMRLGERGIR